MGALSACCRVDMEEGAVGALSACCRVDMEEGAVGALSACCRVAEIPPLSGPATGSQIYNKDSKRPARYRRASLFCFLFFREPVPFLRR